MLRNNARVKNGNTRMQQFWRLPVKSDETVRLSTRYSNAKHKEYIPAKNILHRMDFVSQRQIKFYFEHEINSRSICHIFSMFCFRSVVGFNINSVR